MDGMDELQGSLGTPGSLCLRLGQAICAATSLLFLCMGIRFPNYSAFCFLVTIMGLVVLWSMILALMDTTCLFIRRQLHSRWILIFIATGDWVLSYMSLAASCSAFSVNSFLFKSFGIRQQLAAVMGVMSWTLSSASFLLNLWLICSVY